MGECVDAGSKPDVANHNKTGGSARTLAHYPADQSAVGDDYSSLDRSDPARVAMDTGQTVATNGPVATAQMGGKYPGGTVVLPPTGPTELRVDWEHAFTTVGDTLGEENDFSKIDNDDFDIKPLDDKQHFFNQGPLPPNEPPDRIVVVTGSRDGCGTDHEFCYGSVNRRTIDLVQFPDGGLATANIEAGITLSTSTAGGVAHVEVDPPAEGYVRAELYWDVDKDGREPSKVDFPLGNAYDFAAVTSPIYASRPATARITGSVVDGGNGAPVAGAEVELCRAGPKPVCVTRTTKGDGTFTPVDSSAGPWTVRSFPPAGSTGRGTAFADLGEVLPGQTRAVTLTLPVVTTQPYIDPSGHVVDTVGQPVSGATVVLQRANGPEDPYVAVPDGAAIMSPGNRVNPGVTGADGAFGWDVLSGWYRLEASKPGCRGVHGEPVTRAGPFHVPPPVVDLDLVVDCRVPDADAPVITVSGATPFIRSPKLDVQVALADASPASAFCLVDGGPSVDEDGDMSEAPAPCGDRFVSEDLADGPHTLTVLAIDDQGNWSADQLEFTVDTTPPTVRIEGVTPQGTYLVGAEPAPTCAADDGGSGLAAPCSLEVVAPPGGVGTWSATATASDKAGNPATATVTWQVVWPFDGFTSPQASSSGVVKAKAGSTIPVKFGLGGDRGLAILAAGWPRSSPTACAAPPGPVTTAEVTLQPGASQLSYDPVTTRYHYNWKTQKEWKGSCRQFTLLLTDGTAHPFVVWFE
jgi:hypothetical protein